MKERGLLDSAHVVMEPPFIKEIIEYPNASKLKPSSIDPYDGNKDPIKHMQMF